MKSSTVLACYFTLLVSTGIASAAQSDLAKLERSIRVEPTYQSASPKYGMLVFGPEMKTRVWLVHDGDLLYIDRNANGDLTEAGEKVVADGDASDREDNTYTFNVGAIVDGNLIHKDFVLDVMNIDHMKGRNLHATQLLTRNPKARTYFLMLDVEMPRRQGNGIGGRVHHRVGSDAEGFLVFADQPQNTPIIHFGGPWQITLVGLHRMTIDRKLEFQLSIGSPGLGVGSTAFVGYENLVPSDVFPTVEITYPATNGEKPFKELYEIKERC